MASLLKAVKLPNPAGFFGRLKHKKLAEEWGDGNKEPVLDGITFYVKYLGSTLVDEPNDQQSTAEAIKTIIAMAKASGKKLQRVAMKINPRGITTIDMVTGEKHLEFSIYRISYCSADASYERVVAFIATNSNETLECHAFLTSKRKVAEAAALTISQAFRIAFELWDRARQEPLTTTLTLPVGENNSEIKQENLSNRQQPDNLLVSKTSGTSSSQYALIDLREGELASETMKKLGFSMDMNLNDSFSKLAESRNQQILGSNVTVNDIRDLRNYEASKDPFMQDQVDDLLTL